LFAANLPGKVASEKAALPDADFYLPVLSLPPALGLYDPRQAPAAPYLKPAEQSPGLPGGDGKRKIGLVWSGSGTHERDHERSVDPAHFTKLCEKIPAQFYAPFTGAGLEKADVLPVMRLNHLIKDFADTAALVSRLDCLISVDTAAAHLAGALGVKTYLLLPHCPDWRWGAKGETTPWYGKHTLLRQQRPGDWDAPLARLAELLTKDV
jgi:ADP-heptose:LPS heptosyltransferase